MNDTLKRMLGAKDGEIDTARVVAVKAREQYEAIAATRKKRHDASSVVRRISGLRARHPELAKFKPKGPAKGSVEVGVGNVVGMSSRLLWKAFSGNGSADEESVAAAGLNVHFYNYLIERAADAQFVMIENQDLPFPLPDVLREHMFAGEHGNGGRRGLY